MWIPAWTRGLRPGPTGCRDATENHGSMLAHGVTPTDSARNTALPRSLRIQAFLPAAWRAPHGLELTSPYGSAR